MKKNRKQAVQLILLALVGFLLFQFVSKWKSIGRSEINSWYDQSQADCAVVLTGGAGRVREGLGLLARGSVRRLIISGVKADTTLREIVPGFPFYGIAKTSDIILEKKSNTTYGNAQQVWPLVEALRCQDLLLITSQMHMPRAFETFSASQTVLVPIRKWAIPTPPSESGLLDFLTEVLKSLFYALWAY